MQLYEQNERIYRSKNYTMIKVIISLILTGILNIIDYFQTTHAVSLVGLSVEANPIGRFMLGNNLGWIKLIVVPILLLILGITIRKEKKLLSWAAYLLLAFYIVVVINNFIVLSRL